MLKAGRLVESGICMLILVESGIIYMFVNPLHFTSFKLTDKMIWSMQHKTRFDIGQ